MAANIGKSLSLLGLPFASGAGSGQPGSGQGIDPRRLLWGKVSLLLFIRQAGPPPGPLRRLQGERGKLFLYTR